MYLRKESRCLHAICHKYVLFICIVIYGQTAVWIVSWIAHHFTYFVTCITLCRKYHKHFYKVVMDNSSHNTENGQMASNWYHFQLNVRITQNSLIHGHHSVMYLALKFIKYVSCTMFHGEKCSWISWINCYLWKFLPLLKAFYQ